MCIFVSFSFNKNMDWTIVESCAVSFKCTHFYPITTQWETISQWTRIWASTLFLLIRLALLVTSTQLKVSGAISTMHWGFLLSYLLHSEFFKVFQTMRSLFQERQVGDSNKYNDCIQHETLRVAVCDIIEDESFCYPALRLQVAIFVFSYLPINVAIYCVTCH